MSDSIDAISTAVPAIEAVTTPPPGPVASPTTSSYADATTEVPEGDGTVVITVTDAQGEVISATTIQPHAPVAATPEPPHLVSFEA